MKILVTGNSGFIGSHLKRHLEAQGHQVTGYDIVDGYDITNREQLAAVFDAGRFDQVYHVAAQAFMGSGEKDPKRDVMINCLGAHNVFAEALKHGCRLLYTSSGAVYGVTDSFPHAEDAAVKPVSNYGCSKLFGEYLLKKYVESAGLDAVYTRFSSVYGPGRKDGPINIFIKRALEGQTITVNGDGSHTRDYCHISDALRGLTVVMKRGKHGGCYNVASGSETSVSEIAERVKQLTGCKVAYNLGYEYDRFDVPRSYFNIEKARSIGYAPQVTLNEGLEKTLSAEKSV